ncbi:putative NADH dehydrogenase, transport associated [Prochlorococcus marinus str. MIT 9515]|uniref:Putative NADH dehydrogenase, transport associated n=1 Tax=Prochlorococcus marinus (strain MIT 9515) TaxID=167542 RepID=A2BU40_PROM5|nr:FAD-dependent oxidoreductase [Prochlorococcus marinus]ABM71301.1 putative NADH dehydrogenase, transport associated [Prochlorococcus marinus str. MIT 9515]
MKSIKKPIVIVGAGFGGMTVASNLKRLNPSLPILVVDSEARFLFKPLMYEVISEELSMWETTPEFSKIFSDLGITFLRNCLTKIRFDEKILEFNDDLHIGYEFLILCTGSVSSNFSVKGVDENCYFFNNLKDLTKLKSFLKQFQNNKIKKNLFVIGAGPSGVEIACKIHDTYKDKFDISIVERSNEILGQNKIFNREEAEKALERRKINILLNSTVQEISEKKISILNDSEIKKLEQDVVIWTAGIKPNLPYIDEQVKQIKGRILVNNKFQIENYLNSFAIGDISIIQGMEELPLTAQVAMQQGDHLAKNIERIFLEQDLLPFDFQDNGEMISLGMGEASISALGVTLSGKLAFEARRLIYASKMPDISRSLKSTASWLFQKKSIINKFVNKRPK